MRGPTAAHLWHARARDQAARIDDFGGLGDALLEVVVSVLEFPGFAHDQVHQFLRL